MNELDIKEQAYEISFISKLEDSAPIKKVLEKNRAVVLGEKTIEKIRLMYPIKHENYGFMGIINFTSPGDALSNIVSDLKLNENLLRYLINKVRVSSMKEGSERKPIEYKRAPRKEAAPKKTFEPALTNEDLEKRIEEILK
ncbi:MAG: 30S ribosomal protein S6 [Patescibacteria group bacterium]